MHSFSLHQIKFQHLVFWNVLITIFQYLFEICILEKLLSILQSLVDKPNSGSADLDELMTYVQFANDEGDYGEGLELGLDLLAFHPKAGQLNAFEKANLLNKRIICLLSTAYNLARRPKFARVVQRHMENRQMVRRIRVLG